MSDGTGLGVKNRQKSSLSRVAVQFLNQGHSIIISSSLLTLHITDSHSVEYESESALPLSPSFSVYLCLGLSPSFFCLSVSLCYCLWFCLSVCLFVSVRLSLCPSLSHWLSLCLSLAVSICPFLSLCLSLTVSVCPFLCLCLSLSLSLSMSLSLSEQSHTNNKCFCVPLVPTDGTFLLRADLCAKLIEQGCWS